MLLDEELEKVVGTIILNGDKRYVQPSSYDIRVGEEIFFSERGEREEIKMGDVRYLQPFESLLLKTIEEIRLPKNMVGIVLPSSKLATRGLIYTGGSIDPGYEGFLWINIRNMGPRYEEIEFGQPIASISLLKFEEEKKVKKGYAEEYGRIDTLPRDRRPQKPERALYDWIKLSSRLDEMHSEIGKVETDVSHMRGLLYGLFYAAIAGIIAGLVVAILMKFLI